jgi:DNA-binding response OmpR family regulator
VRILWADDQADVAKTFRPLLAPLKAKIIDVSDGEQALRRLEDDFFDLAILDLMMPPETWGGLWVLEQMQQRGIQVPVLVLSGEGNQPETIKALRLGARDYIRKEEVEAELLDRVSALAKEMQEQAAAYLLEEAPTPIALPLKRYRAAMNPVARLRRLVELHEAVLRFTALLGLAEVRAGNLEPPAPNRLSFGPLTAPAMGTWNQVRASLRDASGSDGPFRRYSDAIDTRLVERIIKVRNDLAHGGEPSSQVAAELLPELEGGTQQLLGRLRHAGGRFVIPTALDFDGQRFDVDAALLTGDSLALPAARLSAPSPVVKHHPYAVRDDGTGWVDLFPLIASLPGREPSAWRVFVYDGVRGAHANSTLQGSEPVRYIDIWSNERDQKLDEHPTADDLRGITADW